MGLLDLLKKNRQDDEEEDENPEDAGEEGAEGGLLGKLRGIGDSAGGLLGRVLKKGGDGEDDEDAEDEADNPIPGRPFRGETPEASAAASASATPVAAPVSGEAGPAPQPAANTLDAALAGIDLTGAGPLPGPAQGVEGASGPVNPAQNQKASKDKGDSLGLDDLFEDKPVIDPNIRELALSQEQVSIQELAAELRAFLAEMKERASPPE